MIEFQNICKSFAGNPALIDVSFKANNGEILALLGQNGAGKSTLMKILSGAYQKDAGTLFIDGKPVEIHNPVDAEKAGIGIVYQELSGLPDLTVSENIVIGRDPVRHGFLNIKAEKELACAMLERLGSNDIAPQQRLGELNVSQQQICEIAKCIATNPSIVIFDEPTTALTVKEKHKLFEIMRKMRAEGLTIIFITHYLEDALLLSDRCVIMKDGKVAFNGDMKGLDEKTIVGYMLAHKLDSFFPAFHDFHKEKIALEIRDMNDDSVHDCNLQVRYGEVVGLSGLIGAGRTELAQLIFGARKRRHGEIRIDGELCRIRNENDAVTHGIAYISEDRRTSGLNLTLGIDFNIVLPSVVKGSEQVMHRRFFVRSKASDTLVKATVDKLSIKCASPKAKAATLSGGNQQKVSIGKWVAVEPKILIFDEPTKGIDVSAKAMVYEIIRNLAAEGRAIIVISSYNPELQGVCDRIEVMSKGRIVGSFNRGVSEETLILAQQG